MNDSETGKKGFVLLKIIGMFLFVPIFLLLAYLYNKSLYPKYKVTAQIALKGVTATSAAQEIKSKYLVQKVLDKLSVQTTFYDVASPKREIYGDSVPVKLILKSVSDTDSDISLELSTVDNKLELTRDDTVSYPKFNELVTSSFGKFIIMPNPDFHAGNNDVLIKLRAPGSLLDQFYNDLKVKPSDKNNVLNVSILSGNPRKGADFLNTLFKIYGGVAKSSPVIEKTTADKEVVVDDGIKIKEDIESYKKKAAALKTEITALIDKMNHPTDQPAGRTEIDEKQLKIFDAIKPYWQKPVDQFVQVPYVDEIDDQFLRNDLTKYNQAQLEKQRLLADNSHTSDQIVSINRKLMILQSGIAEQIGDLKDDIPAASSSDPGNMVARLKARQASLASVEDDLHAAEERKPTVKTVHVAVVPVYTATTASPISKVVILDKPEDNIEYIPVNEWPMYALALLAGLLIPFTWLMITRSVNIRRRRLFDAGKLKEAVNDLFAVKQID